MNFRKAKPATPDETVRKAALDLAIKAYEHHKNHARFQETQRSWLVLAYFSFSGIVTTGIINSLISNNAFGDSASYILILTLSFHAFIGVLVGLAISKVSREFRRHFKQGDKILSYFLTDIVNDDSKLHGLMAASRMGTSGDQLTGLRQIVAKRLGVAAIHNYMISLMVSVDITIITYIISANLFYTAFSLLFCFVMVATGLFRYNKLMETE